MRDGIALLRDCGTEVRFAGQSRGMRDGWQVCNVSRKIIIVSIIHTSDQGHMMGKRNAVLIRKWFQGKEGLQCKGS